MNTLETFWNRIANRFAAASNGETKTAPGSTSRVVRKAAWERRQMKELVSRFVPILALILSHLSAPQSLADITVTATTDGVTTTLNFTGSLDTSPLGPASGPWTVKARPAVAHYGTVLGGGNVGAPSTTWLSGVTGYVDFNADGDDFGIFGNNNFGPGTFEINNPFGSLTLPGDFSSGGIFTINSFAVFPGSPVALGWDLTPFTLSLPGGQSIFFFPQPPSLQITGPRSSFRYRNRLTVRGTSSKPLSSLQAKWTGRSGFKTTQLAGATSWRVKIPRNILRRKRSVTVWVRGIDEQGEISSIVKRRYRRAASLHPLQTKNPAL